MINVFKAGGNYLTEGNIAYSIRTINSTDKAKYLLDGWVLELGLIDDIEDGVFEEVKPKKSTAKKGS